MTLVVIGTDCTGSCKSNYHTIITMTTPFIICTVLDLCYNDKCLIIYGDVMLYLCSLEASTNLGYV
jgi:hypothetical protein